MNSQFQEKKGTFLLLLALLFLLLAVIYFMFFQPLINESKAKENDLQQLESEVALLNVQINNEENKKIEGDDLESLKLINRLPRDPEIEQLILTLEEIEAISNSRFDNISFSYDGSVPERAAKEEEDDPEEETTTEKDHDAEEDGETTEDLQESVINMEEKPEKLQIINITMDVTSPDYEYFQIFIKEIEKQKRMMLVSSMEFQKPAEQELLLEEETVESIFSTVSITTFYYDEP